jgi:hypothetical protein
MIFREACCPPQPIIIDLEPECVEEYWECDQGGQQPHSRDEKVAHRSLLEAGGVCHYQ